MRPQTLSIIARAPADYRAGGLTVTDTAGTDFNARLAGGVFQRHVIVFATSVGPSRREDRVVWTKSPFNCVLACVQQDTKSPLRTSMNGWSLLISGSNLL